MLSLSVCSFFLFFGLFLKNNKLIIKNNLVTNELKLIIKCSAYSVSFLSAHSLTHLLSCSFVCSRSSFSINEIFMFLVLFFKKRKENPPIFISRTQNCLIMFKFYLNTFVYYFCLL